MYSTLDSTSFAVMCAVLHEQCAMATVLLGALRAPALAKALLSSASSARVTAPRPCLRRVAPLRTCASVAVALETAAVSTAVSTEASGEVAAEVAAEASAEASAEVSAEVSTFTVKDMVSLAYSSRSHAQAMTTVKWSPTPPSHHSAPQGAKDTTDYRIFFNQGGESFASHAPSGVRP